ncbi:MAG: SDR family NAD(P)-dependent oxidoreductase [Hyphomonadaceae bacterium]|jgi:NAD(P)-dependent dehydrogenase (short-subunit alcohol dehydrogenase family)|nr:SDR family NAD(P)-dependent oxidoreductase [Hyphomonadaceae bacterium]
MQQTLNLEPGAHAVIIGATGGIGAAFVAALDRDHAIGTISALSRSGTIPAGVSAKVRAGVVDITDPASISAAASALPAPPRLVIVATGVLKSDTLGLSPEKKLADLDSAALATAFAINAIGPAMVARAFLPLMPRAGRSLFAVLSARVGSISDNRAGGWHGYRASKAALNQLIRTMAIEHARRAPEAVLAALHPGTVDTTLSAPFQAGVPAERLFTPERSATALLEVLSQLTPAQSGRLFDWKGDEVAP